MPGTQGPSNSSWQRVPLLGPAGEGGAGGPATPSVAGASIPNPSGIGLEETLQFPLCLAAASPAARTAGGGALLGAAGPGSSILAASPAPQEAGGGTLLWEEAGLCNGRVVVPCTISTAKPRPMPSLPTPPQLAAKTRKTPPQWREEGTTPGADMTPRLSGRRGRPQGSLEL